MSIDSTMQNVQGWIRNSARKVNYHAAKANIQLPDYWTNYDNVGLFVYQSQHVIPQLAASNNRTLKKNLESLARAHSQYRMIYKIPTIQ